MGITFDKDGKVTGHISSPDRLTKESIEFWERKIGLELRCYKCGKRLQPGDQKDHCKECLELEG